MGDERREPVVTPHDEASGESRRRPSTRRRSPLTVVGVLMLVTGIACLGWVGWQYVGTNITSNQAMDQEKQKLRQSWDQPGEGGAGRSVDVSPGDALALIRIPALDKPGKVFEQPIIAGTGDAQLARGVGWYTTSAKPGQVGNFALAGHRITHGEPFARLLELNVGALVVIETREATYTYKLTSAPRDLTVDDSANWVLDPVPGKHGATPSAALITLTTCTDLFASPHRSVAFGTLIQTDTKG